MLGRSKFLASTIAGVLALGLTTAQADTLRFWTTEEQPERLAKQEEMAAAFKDKTGIEVEVIPVSESDLGTTLHPEPGLRPGHAEDRHDLRRDATARYDEVGHV